MTPQTLRVRSFLATLSRYEPLWLAMQDFNLTRNEVTSDEIWLVNHQPVYTLGRNGKQEHVLNAGVIPVVSIDRGGQVTYHGPGQLVVYVLLDLRRLDLGIRDLVVLLENAVIACLADYGVVAQGDREAPGVYVAQKKIAALGLRVARGCTFHGLSLNVAMDLSPFKGINPCGYVGLEVTQCSEWGIEAGLEPIAAQLVTYLAQHLNYARVEWC